VQMQDIHFFSSATVARGSGGGGGKVSMNDFHITAQA
jgi:hypothetical protein